MNPDPIAVNSVALSWKRTCRARIACARRRESLLGQHLPCWRLAAASLVVFFERGDFCAASG